MRALSHPAAAASRPQHRAAAGGATDVVGKRPSPLHHSARPLAPCRALPPSSSPASSSSTAATPNAHAQSLLTTPRAAAAAKKMSASRPRLPPPRAVRADAAEAAADSSASPQLLQTIADITATVDARVAAALEASAAQAAQAAAEAEGGGGGASSDNNGNGASAANASAAAALRARVEAAVLKLQKGLLERETEVRLMLLAALCGEHLLLLGPPGTAKSELSRRLSGLLGGQQGGDGTAAGREDGSCAYFERLLTRFSVPEELFGPLSMRGLENDQYVRQTTGYLPTAEVAFVDEIFKANSAILNALLTLLNERLFDNGSERLAVPLLTLVGASNELPESEELDALFDRFLLRRQVSQVSTASAAGLARLAAGRDDGSKQAEAEAAAAGTAPAAVVSVDDLRTTAAAARLAVDVPDSVIDLLVGLRTHLQERCEPPVYVSDRRFMKSVSLLQTAAYSDGRDRVSEYDCLLLEHVLGSRPDDARKVRTHVLDTIGSDPGLQQAELVLLGLFGRACALLARGAGEAGGDGAAEVAAAAEEAATLAALLEARHAEVSASLDGGYPELRATLWQSAASARQAAQHLTPPLTENRRRAEDLLREARVLHACLELPAPPGVLERMLPKRYKQFVKGIAAGASAPAAR